MALNLIKGNSLGIDDSLTGTAGNDRIEGLSGDDVIRAGKGDDLVIGGQGNDVVWGGIGADTFQWSAGHITAGGIDYVADFDLRQNDTLSFMSSGGGANIEVLSVSLTKIGTQNVDAGGSASVSLDNNVGFGTDVVFKVKNSVTGAVQDLVLLDAWSGNLSGTWNDYLSANGWSFSNNIT